MNRIFLSALTFVMAVAMAVSCQKENREELGTVRITVTSPDAAQTKVIADGKSVNWVYWAAFDENDKPVSDLNGKIPMTEKEASFDVDLVRDYPYHFVFWAQYEDVVNGQPAYDLTSFFEDGKINVNYNGVANDEYRDAFYKQEVITIKGAGESRDIELTRPFAQINFLAADYLSVEEVEVHTSLKSTVGISGLPTVLNGLDGTVDKYEGVTAFAATAVPTDPAYYTVKKVKHGWYSMNYILASDEKKLNEVTATFTHDKSDKPVQVTVDNVPYQRNHRTNIIGNFLTEIAEVSVIIIEDFDKPDFPVMDDGTPVPPSPSEVPEGGYLREVVGNEVTYTVYNAEGLEAWRKEAHEGTMAGSDNKIVTVNLVLAADIELPVPAAGKSNWTPVGSYATPYYGFIKGNDYTISNLTIISNSTSASACVGFISNADKHANGDVIAENITFDNVHISTKGGDTGTVFGLVTSEGGIIRNVCVTDGTVTSTSVRIGGIAGSCSSGVVIENCTNEVDVTGDNFCGGLVGSIDHVVISDCTNRGNVRSTRWHIGGIVGDADNSSVVKSCKNYGNVTAAGQSQINGDCTSVGGIVGFNNGGSKVEFNYNYGDIKGYRGTGGIVGYNVNGTVTNNTTEADIYHVDTIEIGLVVGRHDSGTFSDNSASGSLIKIDPKTQQPVI